MADITSTPTLIDGNVVLRRPRPGDVQSRFEAGNSPEIQHMYGADPQAFAPVTQQQAQDWVDHHMARDHSWFIDIDGTLEGAIFLHSLNHADKRATLAMGLLRDTQLGKGFGTRALRLIVAHAFDTLGLHRIALRVIAYNTRAIAAYKKAGFVIEGRERESARVGRKWHDDVMMGLLRTDVPEGAS